MWTVVHLILFRYRFAKSSELVWCATTPDAVVDVRSFRALFCVCVFFILRLFVCLFVSFIFCYVSLDAGRCVFVLPLVPTESNCRQTREKEIVSSSFMEPVTNYV